MQSTTAITANLDWWLFKHVSEAAVSLLEHFRRKPWSCYVLGLECFRVIANVSSKSGPSEKRGCMERERKRATASRRVWYKDLIRYTMLRCNSITLYFPECLTFALRGLTSPYACTSSHVYVKKRSFIFSRLIKPEMIQSTWNNLTQMFRTQISTHATWKPRPLFLHLTPPPAYLDRTVRLNE